LIRHQKDHSAQKSYLSKRFGMAFEDLAFLNHSDWAVEQLESCAYVYTFTTNCVPY